VKNYVLNPQTEQQLKLFQKNPSHSLLITGPTGSGKSVIAADLITEILHLKNRLEDYPYKMVIVPEKNSIGIAEIRKLEHFLSLKVPISLAFNRAVIIENGHALTTEAQNALLKTLEEPPEGTILVLTANNPQSLLPTLRSRAQFVKLEKPSRKAVESFFDSVGYDKTEISRAYSISGGLPGLMSAILAHKEHPLLLATDKARQFLRSTAYERLILADELAKQLELAQNTIFIMQQMAYVSLQSAKGSGAKRWQTILAASYSAAEELNNSAQPRLVITNLALAL
jgi:hypothetical protein